MKDKIERRMTDEIKKFNHLMIDGQTNCGATKIKTVKLKCKVCEEITEHDVLERPRRYIDSMIGGTHGTGSNIKLRYKCTKCGRELRKFDVFLEGMRG